MISPGTSTLREVFSFPHPANEYAARMVAGMVVALSLVIVLLDVHWLMFFLAYGFLARVIIRQTPIDWRMIAHELLPSLFGRKLHAWLRWARLGQGWKNYVKPP